MGVSTVASAVYTAQAAYPQRTGNREYGGKERVIAATYTSTAIEAGSTINVCTVPSGAILTEVKAQCEAQAADATLKLVYGTTDLTTDTKIDTVGGDVLKGNIASLVGAASSAATTVTAVTGTSTLDADKDILFTVKYVLD